MKHTTHTFKSPLGRDLFDALAESMIDRRKETQARRLTAEDPDAFAERHEHYTEGRIHRPPRRNYHD